MVRKQMNVSKSLRIEELETRTLLTADVYISEFSASNQDNFTDEDGDSPDWIEITNGGDEAVNLDDWNLTDDAENLDKWNFPDQVLAPGSVLVVYASDKDRAETGNPLHTNFKLKSGGEYLALTRTAQDQSIEVIAEFAPQYPIQLVDVSYGHAQTVEETIVSSSSAASKYVLPTGELLGNSWTDVGFDDSAWTDASGGIGYQRIIPGFTVQNAKATGTIENISEALAVLDGEGQESQTTVVTPVVDFTDNSFDGFFEGGTDFPNGTPGDDDDFAVRATGVIEIPTSGMWILGFLSDDGGRMLLNGEVLINDDVLRGPEFSFEFVELEAGPHEIEVISFERGGGAELEIFTGRNFQEPPILIGDTENGGVPVFTSGGGGTVGGLFGTEIGDAMQGNSTDALIRVPFNVEDPSLLESLTLRMNYDDGFVAYLNGNEVARRNAMEGELGASPLALEARSQFAAARAESIDVSSFTDQLIAGENVLAIHGLNDAIDSNSFLMRAELASVTIEKGETLYFPTPSPGDFNPNVGVEGFLTDEITFDQPHGYYTEAFQLSMQAATEGTTIRYTLDGSEPTAETGSEYTGPITVDKTSTVRARAFKEGLDPSFVHTGTYLFVEDIIRQDRGSATDLGFPARSVGQQTYSYGMDPEIVDDEVWGPQLEAAFSQVPSMSLVMDIDDFADRQTGIYSNANSHGRDWERPASLELINPDGTVGFQQNMGVRVRGGFSRTGSNPKHAFRFFFRDEYGDSKLEYPLFGDEGASEFDKVDLRTSQNYSWAFQGDSRNAFVRDVFSRDLQREMGHPYTRSRFYHLYINGQYWGLFQTQERAEARYAASYFGGDPDDYDVIKSGGSSGGYANEATDGNLDAYFRLAQRFYAGLGDDNLEAYMQVQGKNLDGSRNPEFERLLDVENLIDYMVITYYTGDRDGPASRFVQGRVNNYFAILNRENPDGFKFFEHDSEHSLDVGETNMVSPFSSGGSQERYFNPHWMHEQLAESNAEYRTQFMDRVHEVLFNDGLLSPASAQGLLETRASQIDMAIVAESARWGDSRNPTPFTKTNWETAVASAKRFTTTRAGVLIGQLQRVGWYPENGAPGVLVNDVRQRDGAITPQDVISFDENALLEFSKRFFREGSTWRWLNDGSDPGTAWREFEFDDSEWESDRSQLGYGDGDERSEISFGDDPSNKPVTSYYRKTFAASEPEQYLKLQLRLMVDDGAVVYINGREAVRVNMPEGEIGPNTSAVKRIDENESNFVEFLLPTDNLLPSNNQVAIEVHQFADADGRVTDDDLSFDVGLYGGSLIEGEAPQLYYTTDGSDPRGFGGVVNPTARVFEGGFQLEESAGVRVRAKAGDTWGVLSTAEFAVEALEGDLNQDGSLSSADIDALTLAIRSGQQDLRFDLNGDEAVNQLDLDYIVESVFQTKSGDADLDGDVDFADFLVTSSNFGNPDALWAQGNFDTSADVEFEDFLMLVSNFGFEADRD